MMIDQRFALLALAADAQLKKPLQVGAIQGAPRSLLKV